MIPTRGTKATSELHTILTLRKTTNMASSSRCFTVPTRKTLVFCYILSAVALSTVSGRQESVSNILHESPPRVVKMRITTDTKSRLVPRDYDQLAVRDDDQLLTREQLTSDAATHGNTDDTGNKLGTNLETYQVRKLKYLY